MLILEKIFEKKSETKIYLQSGIFYHIMKAVFDIIQALTTWIVYIFNSNVCKGHNNIQTYCKIKGCIHRRSRSRSSRSGRSR